MPKARWSQTALRIRILDRWSFLKGQERRSHVLLTRALSLWHLSAAGRDLSNGGQTMVKEHGLEIVWVGERRPDKDARGRLTPLENLTVQTAVSTSCFKLAWLL